MQPKNQYSNDVAFLAPREAGQVSVFMLLKKQFEISTNDF